LIFLPPYLPDYNPIEYLFSSIKAWLQCHYKEDIDKDAPISFLYRACGSVTANKAYSWFKCAGY
ncbi:hypothetical protein BS47DRAFT_1261285, partial [Hydnum rufescens UP504]